MSEIKQMRWIFITPVLISYTVHVYVQWFLKVSSRNIWTKQHLTSKLWILSRKQKSKSHEPTLYSLKAYEISTRPWMLLTNTLLWGYCTYVCNQMRICLDKEAKRPEYIWISCIVYLQTKVITILTHLSDSNLLLTLNA